MKKLILLALIGLVCIAAILPPAMPATVWGYVLGGHVGQTVSVSIGRGVVDKTQVILWNGQPAYSVDVPMTGVADGVIAIFKINGVVCGTVALHSGMLLQENLVFTRRR
jgi:hypothetical protein